MSLGMVSSSASGSSSSSDEHGDDVGEGELSSMIVASLFSAFCRRFKVLLRRGTSGLKVVNTGLVFPGVRPTT